MAAPSIILDGGVSSNKFANGANQNAGNFITDRPTTRLHQAPGGSSSLDLSDGSTPTGDKSSTSANRFACGSNQNQGNCITDRSTTRLHHAPGGGSSIDLSDGSKPAAGEKASTSANRFACGSNQNQGNCITDRSTTRLHQAPGGSSSLDLSDGSKAAVEKTTSANRFACGSNQNQGNCITDRSTTRLHQAPGGSSSLDLSDGSKAAVEKRTSPKADQNRSSIDLTDGSKPAAEKTSTSANRFACGSNQNQGNCITDRPTTRLHQAPGGTSSIVLGSDCSLPTKASGYGARDENVNNSNKPPQAAEKQPVYGRSGRCQTAGGASQIVLG